MDAQVDAAVDAARPDPNPRLPADLAITSLEIYQAVQIPIALNGVAVSTLNAPVVEGREAMLRIYVAPGPGWVAQQVRGEVVIGSTVEDASFFYEVLTPTEESSVERLLSTINVRIPAEQITANMQLSVRLTVDDADPVSPGADHAARYPPDGSFASLTTESDDGGLELVLVPVRYEYDNSGRLPDTSVSQLLVTENLLMALYPISGVSLTVRDEIPWDAPPDPWSGMFDFGALLETLIDLKASDGAPSHVYYYALVQPADTLSGACGAICIAGMSYLVNDPSNGDMRVSAGLGYTGEYTAWTIAHELGHAHGRDHAPCNTGGDWQYPYENGGIGVWGYSPHQNALYNPGVYADVMGYCTNQWISDYTYSALFDRVVAVNNLPSAKAGRRHYRFLRLSPAGIPTWGRPHVLSPPQTAPQQRVRFLAADGTLLHDALVPTINTSDGGQTLLLPPLPAGCEAVEIAPVHPWFPLGLLLPPPPGTSSGSDSMSNPVLYQYPADVGLTRSYL